MSVNAPLLPMLSTPGLRSRTNSTGILYLGVWYKKWSNWSCGVGVGQKNPTSTPNVVRNPTLPKNLRLRHPVQHNDVSRGTGQRLVFLYCFRIRPLLIFIPRISKSIWTGKSTPGRELPCYRL